MICLLFVLACSHIFACNHRASPDGRACPNAANLAQAVQPEPSLPIPCKVGSSPYFDYLGLPTAPTPLGLWKMCHIMCELSTLLGIFGCNLIAYRYAQQRRKSFPLLSNNLLSCGRVL